jgi:hypothetical protein
MANNSPRIPVQSSRGPALELSDLLGYGPSVKPSSGVAPRTNSWSAIVITCPLSDGRISPRAEEWSPAKSPRRKSSAVFLLHPTIEFLQVLVRICGQVQKTLGATSVRSSGIFHTEPPIY